jgi:hypothetical protein
LESEANNLCTVFRNELIETCAAAFIVRTMSGQSDEFLLRLIAFPQMKHAAERLTAELDAIETETSEINHLPGLFESDKNLHISAEYSGFLALPDGDGASLPVIPCVPGVETMTIESYSEKASWLLLVNRAGRALCLGSFENWKSKSRSVTIILSAIRCTLIRNFRIL